MNLRMILNTSQRVLRQLVHDRRTLALIFLMPVVLMTVLYFVFEDRAQLFESIAPSLLGIIPFTLMFIITSVAMLRERVSGTLERLLVSPISRIDLVAGYAIAFSILAFIQVVIVSFVTIAWLGVGIEGGVYTLTLVATLSGVLGMAFGLFFSGFAKNEFQAVQFMPAFVLPQFLVCGLFVPRSDMNELLRMISDFLPLTYVVEAMNEARLVGGLSSELGSYVLIISGFIIGAMIFSAISLRSR